MTERAGDRPFYTFLREERQFSFLLAHFLMQRGNALQRFIQLVNSRLDAGKRISSAPLDHAEVYVEYAYLRDRWDSFLADEKHAGKRATKEVRDRANARKRKFIVELFERVPDLHHLAHVDLPSEVAAFNEYFMGPAGRAIVNDIASPGLWSVSWLGDRFVEPPKVFRAMCCLKWSFHIKPDLVIQLGDKVIFVEAKLESPEGSYPTGPDAKIFDNVPNAGKRVGQFQLQKFMFENLLGKQHCQPVVVQKAPRLLPDGSFPTDPVVLTWAEVLGAVADELQLGHSIPFVKRLVDKNRTLKPLGSKAAC